MMILSPPPPKSLSVKVPTTSKVQFGEPFFCTVRQMSGIRSPIFHPYFFAVASSTNAAVRDRKSTRLNSSHLVISYAVFCLKKKKNDTPIQLFCLLVTERLLLQDPL